MKNNCIIALIAFVLFVLLMAPVFSVYHGGEGDTDLSIASLLFTQKIEDACFHDPYGQYKGCLYEITYPTVLGRCKSNHWEGCKLKLGDG